LGALVVGVVADAGVAVGSGGLAAPSAGGVVLLVAGCAAALGAGGWGVVTGWVLLEDGVVAAAGLGGPDAGAVEFDPPVGEGLDAAGFGAGADEPDPPLELEPLSEDDFAAAGFGAGEPLPDPPLGPGAGPAVTQRWVAELVCVEVGSVET
jgi:hypothetical protein